MRFLDYQRNLESGRSVQGSTREGNLGEGMKSASMGLGHEIPSFTYAEWVQEKEREVFQEKLKRILRIGFFYLEMSQECIELMEHAKEFANRFYKDEALKKISEEDFSGYHDRAEVQVESFYASRQHWEAWFSPELRRLAEKMEDLCTEILCRSLQQIGVPKPLWERATAGCSSGNGLCHLCFNHYRPDKYVTEGMRPHRDFGHVTVLAPFGEGLMGKVGGEWTKIPLKANHFLVNFGRTLETLVNGPSEDFAAGWHRVQKVADRISVLVSTSNHTTSPIYRWNPVNNTLEEVCADGKKFLDRCFQETYVTTADPALQTGDDDREF